MGKFSDDILFGGSSESYRTFKGSSRPNRRTLMLGGRSFFVQCRYVQMSGRKPRIHHIFQKVWLIPTRKFYDLDYWNLFWKGSNIQPLSIPTIRNIREPFGVLGGFCKTIFQEQVCSWATIFTCTTLVIPSSASFCDCPTHSWVWFVCVGTVLVTWIPPLHILHAWPCKLSSLI